MLDLLIGFLLGAAVGFLAWRLHALSLSGALAATLTGGLIFGLGHLAWAVLLLAFFISSSVLSKAFSRRKAGLSEKFSKGSQRDWGQVLVNGGLGAILAVLHELLPGQTWPWLAFAGAMAAVNADTWSTELGVLSRMAPRLITSGEPVERGDSGGVTRLGTLAALSGAALIAAAAALFTPGASIAGFLAIVILAGLLGSLFDSVLGATVQAIYYCPQCKKETEKHPYHTCGTKTVQIRGWSWLNNDWVNFACSLVGAALAAGLWKLFLA